MITTQTVDRQSVVERYQSEVPDAAVEGVEPDAGAASDVPSGIESDVPGSVSDVPSSPESAGEGQQN